MMFRFAEPNLLWWLFPLVGLGSMMLLRRKRLPLFFSWRRVGLLLGALFLLVLALARPQVGAQVAQPQVLRSNLFLAIDVSQSMNAEDILPSRSRFATLFAQQVIEHLSSSRVALFPFSEGGFLQVPLTTDFSAVSDLLPSIDPSISSHTGTSLSSSLDDLEKAIRRAEQVTRERGEEWSTPRVLLLSDGESHDTFSKESLKYYREKHIPIFTVGIGTETGATIPQGKGFGYQGSFLRNAEGRPVVTKLEAAVLQTLATESGGTYFVSRYEEIPRLISALNRSLQLGKLTTQFKVQSEFYAVFVLIAFFLLAFEFLKGRWQYAIRSAVGIAFFCASYSGATPSEQAKAIENYNHGLSKLKGGEMEQAAEAFQESALLLKDGTYRKQAWFNLGNTFVKMGDPEQALEAYQRARDTAAESAETQAEINQRISENIALAKKIEKQKNQGKPKQGQGDGEGQGQNAQDQGGPKKFAAEPLSEGQKKRLYDLVASEERQTQQKLFDKNRNQQPPSAKPW